MSTSTLPLVDLLEEDKPIAQQKFVCMSFVSPENVIASKQEYLFTQFVQSWDLMKSMDKYAQFTAFLAYKYHLDSAQVSQDLAEFCKDESKALNDASHAVAGDYKSFLEKHGDTLEQQYSERHNFQTSVRGVKVRGVFPSQPEAELRAKLLRETDPYFDVYVGPVGVWMPWEPDAYKTGRVEYLEEELNKLMHKKKDNEDAAKDYFQDRVRESKKRAIEENRAKAAVSGNKLTQTLSEQGDLVGVKNMNTQVEELERDGEEVTPGAVRKLLFENENVVTKSGGRGLE
jgi:hypothetical protein